MSLNVGSYVSPLSQFEFGETAYACVFYGCADIFYSGPTGGQPTGSAEDIDKLADDWYVKINGSLAPSNQQGATIGQEYQILQGMGLAYAPIPANTGAVVNALNGGKPVLITGAESGFFDVELGRVPYAWSPLGNHCIIACGLADSGNILVRDYANVQASPGSIREYSNTHMSLLSATVVTPKWHVDHVVSVWLNSYQEAAATAMWGAELANVPYTLGIGLAWQVDYRAGKFHGPPVSMEESGATWDGRPITVQRFQGGWYEWDASTNTATWYPYS